MTRRTGRSFIMETLNSFKPSVSVVCPNCSEMRCARYKSACRDIFFLFCYFLYLAALRRIGHN